MVFYQFQKRPHLMSTKEPSLINLLFTPFALLLKDCSLLTRGSWPLVYTNMPSSLPPKVNYSQIMEDFTKYWNNKCKGNVIEMFVYLVKFENTQLIHNLEFITRKFNSERTKFSKLFRKLKCQLNVSLSSFFIWSRDFFNRIF